MAEIGIEFAKNCFLLIMLFMATGGHAATEAQIKRVKSKGFYLKVYSGEGWIKEPGDLRFKKIRSGKTTVVKPGTIVSTRVALKQSAPKILFGADYKLKKVIHGEKIFEASLNVFKRESWFRTDFNPDNFRAPAVDIVRPKRKNKNKVLTFVSSQRSAKQKLKVSGKKPKNLNFRHIVPYYPDAMAIFEPLEFPVTVDFGWPNSAPQVDPHNLYLWEEGRTVLAPYDTATGGKTSIDFNRYGTFYWQVEDGSGRFISAPREIVIRKPLVKQITKASKEDMKGSLELIPIERPKEGSMIVGCGVNDKIPTVIVVNTRDLEANRFDVESVPKNRVYSPRSVSIDRYDESFLKRLPIKALVTGEASVKFRVRGYNLDASGAKQLVGVSEWINIQTKNRCNRVGKLNSLSKMFGKDTVLPEEGSVSFIE